MPYPKILLAGDARLASLSETQPAGEGPVAIVGWREWAALPDLGIARIGAKIDTGAKTSALHTNAIDLFAQENGRFVRFDVTGEAEDAPWHVAPVIDVRIVKSSNGEAEERVVIRTALALAGRAWPIELTLTNRERMELPMLVGREALSGRVLVDPQKSWAWGRMVRRRVRKTRKRVSAKAKPD